METSEIIESLRDISNMRSASNFKRTICKAAAKRLEQFSAELEQVTAERDAALREQEERRWIPVTERLPDKEFWEHNKLYENEDLEVQVIIKGAKMATTLLYNAEGDFYSMDADGEIFYVVTHWMPMPEPPKDGTR